MKHDLPPLDSLKVFEASARLLSFSQAADELCMTKGAVSYHIKRLEEHLHCMLFRRAVRQIYLTEAGQELLKTSTKILRELRQTFAQLQGWEHQESVSIAVTTYVAVRWLSSNISDFTAKYPKVSIVFQHSVNEEEFKLADVDMALRWRVCVAEPDEHCLLQAPVPMFPVCSAKLLEQLGYAADTQLTAAMMLHPPWCDVPLLCEDRPQDFWAQWFEQGCSQLSQQSHLKNPRRTLKDSNVRVQAAVDGQGWMLADQLMANEIDHGLLVAPFNEQMVGYGYALLSQSHRVMGTDAQRVRDWLMQRLQKMRPDSL